MPLRGSGGTSAGWSEDHSPAFIFAAQSYLTGAPMPAELAGLLEGPAVLGAGSSGRRRHLSVVTEPAEREPEPGETCSCGAPAVVVFITERFGDVASCKR